MKKFIIILGAAVSATWAMAQDLHKEITVDRTVQPALRESTRLSGLTPTIQAPAVTAKILGSAEYAGPATLTNDISVLPPAPWADSIQHTPYRGYATLGYLPLYNVLANIGYRILDTPKYGLGLWAQYDGYGYNGDIHRFDGALFANHFFTIGGNGSVRFGKHSLLSASGSINVARIRCPYFFKADGIEHKRSYWQSEQDMYAELNWASRAGNFVYDIGGALRYFLMGENMPDEINGILKPDRQAGMDFNFGIGLADDDASNPWIGLNFDLAMLKSRNIPQADATLNQIIYKSPTMGEVNLHPYVSLGDDDLKMRIGLNVSVAVGDQKHVRVAPEVSIGWKPMSNISVYGSATGGEHLNYMSDIFAQNPYVVPYLAYGRTNMPLIVKGGINLWPMTGLCLSIEGGYAMAKDYLSPLVTILRNGLSRSSYTYNDVNSWYGGVSASYTYNQLFTLNLKGQYGDSNMRTHSWYQWIDAAKWVGSASLTVHPMDLLDVSVGYDYRGNRKAQSIVYPYDTNPGQRYVGIPNLGAIQDLHVGATYQVNSQLTAFLTVNNILNKRYFLISVNPAEGINGLLGATYKF